MTTPKDSHTNPPQIKGLRALGLTLVRSNLLRRDEKDHPNQRDRALAALRALEVEAAGLRIMNDADISETARRALAVKHYIWALELRLIDAEAKR